MASTNNNPRHTNKCIWLERVHRSTVLGTRWANPSPSRSTWKQNPANSTQTNKKCSKRPGLISTRQTPKIAKKINALRLILHALTTIRTWILRSLKRFRSTSLTSRRQRTWRDLSCKTSITFTTSMGTVPASSAAVASASANLRVIRSSLIICSIPLISGHTKRILLQRKAHPN